MAKVEFKGPVASYSGTIDDLVYVVQPNGSVYVRRLPTIKGRRKPGQIKQQDRITQAAAYWRSVMRDPVKLAVYTALAPVPGLGPRHFGIRDFCHAPEIGEIDVSGYSGQVGTPIRVTATDDTAVVEVGVEIVDMTEAVLEEGLAMREGSGNTWLYVSSKPLPSGQTVSIHVTAKDHPGNSTAKSCLAYVR